MHVHYFHFRIIMQRVKQCILLSNVKPATWKYTITIIPRWLDIRRDYDYAECWENFMYKIILKKKKGKKKGEVKS